MDAQTWTLYLVFSAVILLGGYALARYMHWVYDKAAASSFESFFFRVLRINAQRSMSAGEYIAGVLAFSVLGVVILVALQRLQGRLPLNPNHLPAVPWDLALNTAVSFVTNTNWQAYSGESTLSHLTQMVGLGTQNFVSAAAGMAVAVALARGFRNHQAENLGNFWQDLFRGTFYVLLPLSLVLALFLIGEGVVQNFSGNLDFTGSSGAHLMMPGGPAASQIAIKQLGTNGGGFFGEFHAKFEILTE
jgi:K+-transporting ATPase ATPase A chain